METNTPEAAPEGGMVTPDLKIPIVRRATCPRRAESFNFPQGDDLDGYRDDSTCSFCGSLDPDEFMRRLEAQDIVLGPTDKSYKVYLKNKGGAAFKQTYRTDGDRSGDTSKWVWETREIDHSKFYFQHLSDEQKHRFVELINEKKLHFGYPGHFYVLPFFIKREGARP